MAFPPSFLDELRMRLPPSQVIARRVRLVRKGREFQGLCPFHNEKTPSFTVNDEKGFFHCFGCGAHGDVIGFTMRTEGVEFPEAVERLAREAGLQVPVSSPAERHRASEAEELLAAVEAACAWFERQLRGSAGQAGLDYLRRRGLDDATIAAFRLGWAPDRRVALKQALTAAGFAEDRLLQAGLLSRPAEGGETFDFLRGRVVFPIMDPRGRPIAFGGRVLGDGQPKYLNSRDTPLFDKGRGLYALDKARDGIRLGATAIVAEGYMDVIALHAAGFTGAVAPLGTALTEAQIELLWRLAPEPVLCLDGDAAGQRAMLRAADRVMPLLRPGHSLRFALLPAGADPDSLIRDRGAAAMQALVDRAEPLIEALWRAERGGRPIDTPERRALIEQGLEAQIARIADRKVQGQYRSEIRERVWAELRGRRIPASGAASRRSAGLGAWRGRGKPPPPDTGLRTAGDVGVLAERHADALIATLIHHPELIHEEAESLAGLELPAAATRAIDCLLEAAASGEDLDSGALTVHLKGSGLAALVSRVLQPSLYKFCSFSAPDAPVELARQGLRDIVGRFLGRRVEGEIRAAERELARDTTEESWARLRERQRDRQEQIDASTRESSEDSDAPPSGPAH